MKEAQAFLKILQDWFVVGLHHPHQGILVGVLHSVHPELNNSSSYLSNLKISLVGTKRDWIRKKTFNRKKAVTSPTARLQYEAWFKS